jgi:hypothetical protein
MVGLVDQESEDGWVTARSNCIEVATPVREERQPRRIPPPIIPKGLVVRDSIL